MFISEMKGGGGNVSYFAVSFNLVRDLSTKYVAVFRFEPRSCYIWTRKMSLKKYLSQIAISDLFEKNVLPESSLKNTTESILTYTCGTATLALT